MPHKIKFLAYYLPQYHAIPENDEWWGNGFTEWTNVKKAQPLFKGHQQPIRPGELGFYDLLQTPNIQRNQAKLAKEYGLDGFIYYQYWFGKGKMLLEKPAENMLKDKSIDMPFCFCWANETWKGIWHGLDNPDTLMEQTYNGKQEYIEYFNYLLPYFKDERYIKVDNKPMFHIYRLDDIPDLDLFIATFNDLAKQEGFDGIYYIATGNTQSPNILNNDQIKGVVAIDSFRNLRYSQMDYFIEDSFLHRIERKIKKQLGYYDWDGKRKKPLVVDYVKGLKKYELAIAHDKIIPCTLPNWDNSPRSGNKSLVLTNATPASFKKLLYLDLKEYQAHPANPPFCVLKSWNEWAEGNYLEPDAKYGRQWLEALREVKKELDL